MHLIGASCLRNVINALPYYQRRKFPVPYTAIGGLSLNENAVNDFQNLRFLLSKGKLKTASNIVLWHGVISNTLSKHRLNGKSDPEESVKSLIKYLTDNKDRFRAIIYCQRTFAIDAFEQLKGTSILILNVRKVLISNRKRKCKFIDESLGEVHPDVEIELNILQTVLNRINNLQSFVKRRRSKRKTLTSAQKLKEKERKKRQKQRKKMNPKQIGATSYPPQSPDSAV